jgi:hypothetical protein
MKTIEYLLGNDGFAGVIERKRQRLYSCCPLDAGNVPTQFISQHPIRHVWLKDRTKMDNLYALGPTQGQESGNIRGKMSETLGRMLRPEISLYINEKQSKLPPVAFYVRHQAYTLGKNSTSASVFL